MKIILPLYYYARMMPNKKPPNLEVFCRILVLICDNLDENWMEIGAS